MPIKESTGLTSPRFTSHGDTSTVNLILDKSFQSRLRQRLAQHHGDGDRDFH